MKSVRQLVQLKIKELILENKLNITKLSYNKYDKYLPINKVGYFSDIERLFRSSLNPYDLGKAEEFGKGLSNSLILTDGYESLSLSVI